MIKKMETDAVLYGKSIGKKFSGRSTGLEHLRESYCTIPKSPS